MVDAKEVKLIISDLDGTISDSKKELDSGLPEVVRLLRSRGVFFTLASGRNDRIMKKEVETLGIHNIPYITDGGSNIYIDHKVVKTFLIDRSYTNYLLRLLAEKERPITFFYQNKRYRYLYERSKKFMFISSKLPSGEYGVTYDPSMDISEEALYKITFDSIDYPEIDSLIAEMCSACPNIEVNRTEDTFYTILSPNTSKGTSCRWICDYMGIDPDKCMCIGDNYNDLSMFEVAGVRVAMSNSDDAVKSKADIITEKDCNHNGVSDFLRDYFKL